MLMPPSSIVNKAAQSLLYEKPPPPKMADSGQAEYTTARDPRSQKPAEVCQRLFHPVLGTEGSKFCLIIEKAGGIEKGSQRMLQRSFQWV